MHAVVVRDGEVAESWGDPEVVSFVRSAAKPLQALPLVPVRPARGRARDRVRLARGAPRAARRRPRAPRACRRHDRRSRVRGRARLQAAPQLLGQARRLSASSRGSAAGRRRATGCRTTRCSRGPGARRRGRWPGARVAVDGCGVPTFALSLVEMARVFAGLVRGEPAGADTVVRAMTAYPQLIGGPGAVDTLVMRALPGSVAKRGAEGVLCVGLAGRRGRGPQGGRRCEPGRLRGGGPGPGHRRACGAAGAQQPGRDSWHDLGDRLKIHTQLFHKRCRIRGRVRL